MKKELVIGITFAIFVLVIRINSVTGQTYCNPLNLSYPVNTENSPSLNISDPTIVLYKDKYFLFATNAGGYWFSNDLLSWRFVTTAGLPLQNQSPTAVARGDWLYFFSSFDDKIFRSNDPASGKWELYNSKSILLSLISDFAIFADTDGRVYSYYGCSNNNGVMSREMDPKNFLNPIGVPVDCKKISPLVNQWKKYYDNLPKKDFPGVKGSWMNKYKEKYYYQCSELNADRVTYSNAVYVSDSPHGPFTYAANNPFSYRPNGFFCGAGDGATFQDKFGNWWHVATINAPGNRKSQTRLGLFPAGFDSNGNLFTKTDFGDYPIVVPGYTCDGTDKLDPKWSLLADNISAAASSSLAANPVSSAFDENSGTYWSAQTGNKGEWLSVDLGSVCTINAFQLNFAFNKIPKQKPDGEYACQYLVQYSIDRKNWKALSDKTSNNEYLTNPYEELKVPVQAQYVKITNYHVPEGTFAISGFRIFGTGANNKPKKVNSFRTVRDFHNPQIIKLYWDQQSDAAGYNIRYGIDKDKLYHSYQVFKENRLILNCPDKNRTYWIEIDAFNENGVTPGKQILSK